MQYRQLVDFHIHTDNSCDGHDSLTYMCEQAAARGIRALAVTDHAECQRYFTDSFHTAIRYSFFETLKARSAFMGQIAVMTGMELGQPLHDLKAADDALHANSLDFIIASLHCLRGQPDFWQLDYSALDPDRLLSDYFAEVYDTVCWGQFDSLGHLTYPLRYMVGRAHLPVELSRHADEIDEILKRLVADGKALELNTQGYRTEYGRPTPDLPLLRRFRELGGEYVTIGSDAHYAADVGANIADGLALLQEAGFSFVTLYDRREPVPVVIR